MPHICQTNLYNDRTPPWPMIIFLVAACSFVLGGVVGELNWKTRFLEECVEPGGGTVISIHYTDFRCIGWEMSSAKVK